MRSTRVGAALIGLGAALTCLSAGEAKAVDIGAGPFQSLFEWNGTLPATAIPTFEVTVGGDSTIDVALEDTSVDGDVFQLLLNGNPLTLSSTGFTADGDDSTNPLLGDGLSGGPYFYGIWDDVALAPGLNVFSIQTTAGLDLGLGFAYFSAVEPKQVPGPLPLLGAAAAFGYSRRLRRLIRATGARRQELNG